MRACWLAAVAALAVTGATAQPTPVSARSVHGSWAPPLGSDDPELFSFLSAFCFAAVSGSHGQPVPRRVVPLRGPLLLEVTRDHVKRSSRARLICPSHARGCAGSWHSGPSKRPMGWMEASRQPATWPEVFTHGCCAGPGSIATPRVPRAAQTCCVSRYARQLQTLGSCGLNWIAEGKGWGAAASFAWRLMLQ